MKITRKTYYLVNFILLFIILIFSFVVATNIMYQDQKKLSEEKTELLTAQATEEMNGILTRANTISRTMFLSKEFQDLADEIYTNLDVIEQIFEHFNVLISMDSYIKNAMYVPLGVNGELDPDGVLSYGNGYSYIKENLSTILEVAENETNKDGRVFFQRLYYDDGDVAPYFALARKIIDIRTETYFNKMGVGVLFIDGAQIETLLDKYAFAFDGVNFCVAQDDLHLFSSSYFKDESLEKSGYYVQKESLDSFSWNIYGVFDKSYIWKTISDNFIVLIFIMLVASVSIIFIMIFVKRKSTESLDYLFGVFSDFGSKEEINPIPYTSDKEVNNVIKSFNEMIRSVKNLNDEVLLQKNKELKLELRNSEYMLSSLHSQINKHFLINILSIIRSLISCGEKEKAKNCIEDLSEFLRGSLTIGDKISIGEEFKTVKSYLNIQKDRYPRIETEVDCPKNCSDVIIPKMILQPIIENSYVHGLQKKIGKIKVVCREKKDCVYFFIMDNGKGIERNKLKIINESLKEHKKIPYSTGNGIALNNIEQRIRLISGEKSRIRLLSVKDKGTLVVLKIQKGVENV